MKPTTIRAGKLLAGWAGMYVLAGAIWHVGPFPAWYELLTVLVLLGVAGNALATVCFRGLDHQQARRGE